MRVSVPKMGELIVGQAIGIHI